jgi:hypothetical protein
LAGLGVAPAKRPRRNKSSGTVCWGRDHRAGPGSPATELIGPVHARVGCWPDDHGDRGGCAHPMDPAAGLVSGRLSFELLPSGRPVAAVRSWCDLLLLPTGDASYPLAGDLRRTDSVSTRHRRDGRHLSDATDSGGPTALSRPDGAGPSSGSPLRCWPGPRPRSWSPSPASAPQMLPPWASLRVLSQPPPTPAPSSAPPLGLSPAPHSRSCSSRTPMGSSAPPLEPTASILGFASIQVPRTAPPPRPGVQG